MAAVAHPTRPQIRRNSPLSVSNGVQGFSANAPMLKSIDIGDSDSDDEPPPAIKFSKVTQALLDDAPAPSSPPKQDAAHDPMRFNRSFTTNRAGSDTPSRAPGLRIIRNNSPAVGSEGSRRATPPRVVQLSSKGSASAKRSVSISGPYPHRLPAKREPTPTRDDKQEMITPAPGPRALRVRTRANSVTSQDGQPAQGTSSSRPGSRNGASSAAEPSIENTEGAGLSRSASLHHPPETISRFGTSTIGRSRNPSADAAPPPGSTRIKRAPIGAGSFLKHGPVRRGFRRRDSEENASPNDEPQSGSTSQPSERNFTPREGSASRTGSAARPDGTLSRSGSVNGRAPSVEPVSVHDWASKPTAAQDSRPGSRQTSSHLTRSQRSNDSRPPSRTGTEDRVRTRQPSVERPTQKRQTSFQKDNAPAASVDDPPQRRTSIDKGQHRQALEQKPMQRAPSLRSAQYRYVGPKVNTDASDDQENIPPPTFKRNKDAEFKHLDKPAVSILSDHEKPKPRQTEETPVPVPAQQKQDRKVLGTISGNTPHRTAPAPPPKMSVIDTATTTAGASVTKSKKRRAHMTVNGKVYTQMGKIGAGGSSQVYFVMAENFKTFALKKVKLEDADESAVRGYKGEIDLLKKLEEVERVVRLYDWELSEEKQELYVLMEKGDVDLNKLLSLRLSEPKAEFDPVFTRYHWREMLECVKSVHDKDIVHSDLKPANFLLVQGRLKLIDFGIANAIDTDNTVNVHRDTHVGTPNYMSPESITDTNAPQPGSVRREDMPVKKDMRIGKASDVWSLGCILYQMTYGRPPFAHIQNQLSRIMAITNPNHDISFPDTGIGDATIAPALKGVLRRCLNRDPSRRPTVDQLLGKEDVYLHPEQPGTVMMSEELLGQIIAKVVQRCGDGQRGLPGAGEVQSYPRSFMEKIREMVEKG